MNNDTLFRALCGQISQGNVPLPRYINLKSGSWSISWEGISVAYLPSKDEVWFSRHDAIWLEWEGAWDSEITVVTSEAQFLELLEGIKR